IQVPHGVRKPAAQEPADRAEVTLFSWACLFPHVRSKVAAPQFVGGTMIAEPHRQADGCAFRRDQAPFERLQMGQIVIRSVVSCLLLPESLRQAALRVVPQRLDSVFLRTRCQRDPQGAPLPRTPRYSQTETNHPREPA